MNTTGDISEYQGLDPDGLYYGFPNGSMTFFYIPRTQELHIAPYPENHNDMLQDSSLFQAVFGEPANSRTKRELGSRGSALSKGTALLGRIALDGTTPLIAFWKSELVSMDVPVIQGFFSALYKKIPAFERFKSTSVLLLPDKAPMSVDSFLDSKPAQDPQRIVKKRQPRQKLSQPKIYDIDGQKYSLADLQDMRAAVHTKGVVNPVLCHPDLSRYPELSGYRPVNCKGGDSPFRTNHPQNWRVAGRSAGMPYLYTAEGFRDWFDLRDVFTDRKGI